MLQSATNVTIVSSDRDLLRRLAWTLDDFGYRRAVSGDWSSDAMWRRCSEPEIWLLDTRDPTAIEAISTAASNDELHVIALSPRELPSEHEELLVAGADDVVPLPPKSGELAARLRAGVRHLEFKRRLALRAARDPATGLLTRSGMAWWAMSTPPERGVRHSGLVVVFRIDGMERIRERLGADVALALQSEFADAVRQAADQSPRGVAARLDDAVYAIALPDSAPGNGAAIAEQAISDFHANNAVTQHLSTPPAVSAVVGDWSVSWTPSAALESFIDAVKHASLCSERAVASFETINAMLAEWKGADPRPSAIENASAAQIAEPLPVVLEVGHSVGAATAWSLLPAASLPPVTPVVDEDGKLVGVFDPRFKDELGSQPLGAEMVTHVDTTVPHDTPVSELTGLLDGSDASGLVVVEDDRPVGYLTAESVNSLLSSRHGATSYRRRNSVTQLENLVVPSGAGSAPTRLAT